jgi:hypothetical protein
MDTADLIASFVASVLTIMVLSYLIGDNPLFKLAMHLLIGVAAGYAGAVAVHSVLLPGLVQPLLDAGLNGLADPQLIVTVIVPMVLVGLLFLKISPGDIPSCLWLKQIMCSLSLLLTPLTSTLWMKWVLRPV